MTAEDHIEDIFNRLYIVKIILMKQHRPLLGTRVWKCLMNHAGKPRKHFTDTLAHNPAQFHGMKGHQPSDLIKVQ